MVWKVGLFLACLVLQLEAKPLTFGFEYQNRVFLKAIKNEIKAIETRLLDMFHEEEDKQSGQSAQSVQSEAVPTELLDMYQQNFSSWLYNGHQSKRETWNNQILWMKVKPILLLAYMSEVVMGD